MFLEMFSLQKDVVEETGIHVRGPVALHKELSQEEVNYFREIIS